MNPSDSATAGFIVDETIRLGQDADRSGGAPELDALVVALNDHLSLLVRLQCRLTTLRLLLLDGDPRFVQLAAQDVAEATAAVEEHTAPTTAAFTAARTALGAPATRMIDLASTAPESHRKVLVRLARETDVTSRALTALSDAVTRQSTAGRDAVANVLDLTDGPKSVGSSGQLFTGAL